MYRVLLINVYVTVIISKLLRCACTIDSGYPLHNLCCTTCINIRVRKYTNSKPY